MMILEWADRLAAFGQAFFGFDQGLQRGVHLEIAVARRLGSRKGD